MYIVDFPPGYSIPIHRHNASSYVSGEKLILEAEGHKYDATCCKL